MTFEFSPDLLEAAIPGGEGSTVPPAQANATAVAALVRELFAEGTLSWEQLRELARLPELASLLAGAVAEVPVRRRGG